ncbi:MAG: DegQ family serine endoprotease [Rhodospirillales bacterium]|nr:DegQ family serine endoprotease [Rhodospirillales bacterium]
MKQTYHTKQKQARAIAAERENTIAYWAIGLFVTIAFLLMTVTAQARSTPESFADLAEKLIPSVVTISSTQGAPKQGDHHGQGQSPFNVPPGSPFEEFFKDFLEKNRPQQDRPQRRRPASLGSGFIIDEKGFVVTNNHVIANAAEITVVLHDGTSLKAKLVGTDPETDIAVLKVDPKGHKFSVATFGDSDKARVGDWVIAIGNPFGLGSTVTAGIISARGRDINAGRYDDFIQTDASINKGNSGGPLFNADGEVIGVNTLIYSPSGGSVGIGFSVPATVVKPVVTQLMNDGEVKRGWLGVRIQTVTDEIAESLDMKKTIGALVASVSENSPAAKAKIKARDVIIEFNGREVTDMRKLPRIVAETEIGKAVDVVVWRKGKPKTVQVTVGELKDEKIAQGPKGKKKGKSSQLEIEELGLSVATIDDKIRQRFELADDAKGVIITGVKSGGAAEEKGIQVGDVVLEVAQEEVETPQDIKAKVKKARDSGRKSVLLLVEGQGGLRFVAVRFAKK